MSVRGQMQTLDPACPRGEGQLRTPLFIQLSTSGSSQASCPTSHPIVTGHELCSLPETEARKDNVGVEGPSYGFGIMQSQDLVAGDFVRKLHSVLQVCIAT